MTSSGSAAMTGVDVVVVTYRSSETVADAVEPLTGVDWVNVIVVDNASGDGTVDLLRDAVRRDDRTRRRTAASRTAATPAGAPAARRTCSSSTRTPRSSPSALARLVEALEREERVGAVAPRIEEPDGSLDYSLRRFPRLRSSFAQALFLHRVFPKATWVDEVIRDPAAYEHAHPAEWVSGACFAVRRSVLEEIGGLDESFFHYSEDVDICARVWRSGREVRFVPAALAEHEGGASAPRARLLPILAASRIRYSAKHDSAPVRLASRASVALGAATHVVVARSSATRRGHLRALGVALAAAPGRT